jgi:tetratricopeptide (TPR) repeat protein/Zn finger protein HypA/HybF involved in hydrogenase expression
MNHFRYSLVLYTVALAAQEGGYIGSAACRDCHAEKYESQSKTAHARALRRAQPSDPGPGSRAQWAFGAGLKATTWVSQLSAERIAEHGLTYYTATKTLSITPGHSTSADVVYGTFDPVATALLCFRCHSTGPITLGAKLQVQPSEPGVHCESCHGPGRGHAETGGTASIQNPRRLTAVQLNTLCGSCHRQASDLDDDRDWSNPWNVRHQPSYVHRAACFRNSNGALSCLTCHDPHQPLKTAAAPYDAKCISCHAKVSHTTPVAARSCVGCHMPQVAAGASLKFTNHWIGIYDPRGRNLIPSRRAVKGLQPAPTNDKSADGIILPADPATLVTVYAKGVAEKIPHAESNLGLFLLQLGKSAEAEEALRWAVASDEQNGDVPIDADREGLALAVQAQGRNKEAFALFKLAAEGKNSSVAARAFVKLAELDPEHGETYYRNAVAAEEKASGSNSQRIAVLLKEYAIELRAHKRDREAEPVLRRALSIQQSVPRSDPRITIEVLNALGNLLEGRQQLDEAEQLMRTALALAEMKFGPESPQLATTCTYLADVLWNKRMLREAGLLFRRAILIDASIYGPERPETAADIANLGMLMKAAGQSEDGTALLRQALAIYEKAFGPNSEEARLVRDNLGRPGR